MAASISISSLNGGYVLSGRIIGFLFSLSLATLCSGLMLGAALPFLGTRSLKVWRQGKSSLPFILGQAALTGSLSGRTFRPTHWQRKLFKLTSMLL